MLEGSNAFGLGPDFAEAVGNEDWPVAAKFDPEEECAKEVVVPVEEACSEYDVDCWVFDVMDVMQTP